MDTEDRDREPSLGLTVLSAGTDASSPARMCTVGLGLVGVARASEAELHRARGLDGSLLEIADLVITASRAERGWIARRRPEMRSRTFTLREVVALGAGMAPGYGGAADEARLDVYAAAIHERRGMVRFDAASRSRLAVVRQTDPLDIVDAHLGRSRAHIETLKRLRSTVGELQNQLNAFTRH